MDDQEAIEVYEKRTKKDTALGMPYNVMKTKCGGEDGLKEAMNRGDVDTQMENGRERYYYHESESSREHGYVDKSRVNVGSKKIDRNKAWYADFSICT